MSISFEGIKDLTGPLSPVAYTPDELEHQEYMFWRRYRMLTKRKNKLITRLQCGRVRVVELEKRCASTTRPWHPRTPNVCDWAMQEGEIVPRLNATEKAIERLVAKMAAIVAGYSASIYAANTPAADQFMGAVYKATEWQTQQYSCPCWRCQSRG
tara:strand:+ start:924 stop:1388 length:465 start_codon:yes stop_codon:yes gene_type:complete